ncbi:MAG: outer membrane protein assembly factor BamA [Pseudomonadota bacterium]
MPRLLPRTIPAGLILLLTCAAWPVLAPAEPGRVRLAQGEEAERVVRIEVEGARRAEPEAIRDAMRTRAGDILDLDRVREDIRRIFALGFFSDVRIEARRTAEGLVLLVVVTEKPAIHSVRIEGNESISTSDLEEDLDIRPYQVFDRAALKRNAAKIAQKYVEKGFFLVSVDYRVEERPDNQVAVIFEVQENSKVRVQRIEFVGNEKVGDEELKAAMFTKEGNYLSFLTGAGIYREEVFERDLHAISGVYYDQGYINVRVDRPTVEISPDMQSISITIPVEEGEQYSIGQLAFSGDILTTEEDLLQLLTVKEGEIFSRSRLQEDIQRITRLYHDEAYAYVNIAPLTRVHPETRRVDITFDIDKGKKVRWERIEIEGNDKTRDKVIRRELRIYEGDYYSGTALERSKARVTALGYFEPDPMTGMVEIETRKGSSDEWIVAVVRVKERPTGTVQVGAGFSSIESFIGTVQISQTNFFGWGQSVQLQAQISSLRQFIQLQVVEPYFLDTRWTASVNFYRTELDYGGFRRNATGGDLTFGHPIPLFDDDDLRLFLTLTAENVDVLAGGSLVGSVPLHGRFFSGFASSARLTLNWDRRNNRLFPSRGFVQSASVERTLPSPLSEIDYTRYTGVTRWYFSLPLRLVLKFQGTIGYIAGDDVPISELYFVGGINSVRGYTLRTISPTVPVAVSGTDPQASTFRFQVGGNKQLVFNTELEFPIFERLGVRGVLFYDMGNAFGVDENFFEFKEKDLPLGMFHSVGFGIRWFSPLGPLRFEWGIPLTRRPEDEGILFEFTIGNSF